MELLYDHPNVALYCVHEHGYLFSKWSGFCPSAVFREASETALLAFKERKISKWLIDARDSKLASPEDQKWIEDDWTPRAIAVGYRYVAFILPADVFGQFSSASVLENSSKHGLTTATCGDADEAQKWLLARE